MTQNLYYRQVIQRRNPIKRFILGLFSAFSSYPRLLLEVFIRKDFGERYFNMGSAIVAVLVFSLYPYAAHTLASFLQLNPPSFPDVVKKNIFWYLFLAAALFMSYRRWREIKRKPGVFDFARYSLSRGKINPFFFDLPIFKTRPSIRTVEILIEPSLFFLIGVLLRLMDQSVGSLIILCSVSYCFSYWADYKAGDDFIMDLIDQYLMNQEMQKDFFEDDIDPDNPRGRGKDCRYERPTKRSDREMIFDAIIVDDEDDSTIAT